MPEGELAAQPAEQVKPAEKPKKKFYQKLWFKIAAVFVAVIVGIVIFTLLATNAAVKVSNQFLDAMQATNASAAYALFSSEAKESVDSDEFEAAVEQVGPILNTQEKITGREISSSTENGSSAKITYEIKGTDDLDYVVVIELVKEDGDWKVQNFDSDEAK